MKAQLSTEYLIILTVVLLLALVVLYLVGGIPALGENFFSGGGNWFLSQNNQYWASMYPIAIIGSAAGYNVNGVATNYLTLQITNQGMSPVLLNNSMASVPCPVQGAVSCPQVKWGATLGCGVGYSPYYPGCVSSPTIINPGQTITQNLTLQSGPVVCTSSGLQIGYNITFVYDLPGTTSLPLLENSPTYLVVPCS